MTRFMCQTKKQCLADASLHVPLDEIKVDKTLRFVEEPVEIIDREIRNLKRSKISLVKGGSPAGIHGLFSGRYCDLAGRMVTLRVSTTGAKGVTIGTLVQLRHLINRYWDIVKLAPRFVGPFEIIEKVGPVAYRLDLPEDFNGVHVTFHVSNLKKSLADPTL
ncbi:hypothetical protein Tco_0829166, partial [Tanacetum coccineum]